MSELTRANKVTVKANADGKYMADFYRTHKKLATVLQDEVGWVPDNGMTRTGERESFRLFVIQNASTFGIDWNPVDMRDASNVRSPKYETDEQLMDEAVAMVTPDIEEMASKCKYPVSIKSIDADTIEPKTRTGKGIPLSGLGIKDGRYEKSGNWAWANIMVSVALEYEGNEIYYNTVAELVSGQLKKPKITITAFNEDIKNEIISAGLATAEELDPPKDTKPEEPVATDKAGEPEVDPVSEILADVDEQVQDTSQDEVVEDGTVQNKSGRKRKLGK